MKKILSLVLALMMVFSIVPAVFADDAVTTAAKDSAYQDAIDFLGLIGLYKGGDGHADSDGVTRWQMALYVARVLTGRTEDAYWKTTENNSGFADVDEYLNDSESYIVGAVSYAANKGIINGYGDGNFGPNDGITYRDALTMVVRALGITYPASGYPWSYVTKADELGLMDGITGVGQTEEISREVVAQILYNAVNADVDGKTIAEEVFGVGEMTVIITASNKVAYEGSTTVLRDGFVQFAAIDDQGNPTGAKYHVAATEFGLTTDNAENAAVGTNYQIVYKDNCVDIIDAKALWTAYENFAATGKNEIVVDAANKTISLGGVKTNLVTVYTDLFNTQGTNNVTGALETKVYGESGVGAWKTIGTTYYMDAQGYIYQIADLKLVAYYFEFFDTIYGCKVETTGKYTYSALSDADAAAIRADLTATANGFAQVTNFASLKDSAYTKVVASDSNNDGTYDRAIVKDFQFGYLDWASDKKTFTIATTNGLNSLAAGATYTTANYRFTGLTPAADAFVIYYVDDVNKEIDIWVEVKAYAEGATTYFANAYILGFSVASNVIYMNDTKSQRFDMPFGYADLNGAPMKAFTTGANANVALNQALIDLLLANQNAYVTYVVVDGKLVYFTAAAQSNDYVVIDKFTSITKDSIIAHAYSTVTDEYADIQIAEFNGWNIGGFEWNEMWQKLVWEGILSGNVPNANDVLATLLPVKANQLYKVVYQNNGAYNLRPVTAADAIATPNGVHVIKEKIHWFKDGVLINNNAQFDPANNAGKYVATSSAHNWLVLQAPVDATTGAYDLTAIEKVYVVPGKIADMIIPHFELYKSADNDFVLVATEAELADFIRSQTVGSDVSFVYYTKYDLYGNDHNNAWADQAVDAHYYYRWMRDVATGNFTLVKINVAEYAAIIAELNKVDAKAAPANAVVLQLNDGVLSLANGALPVVTIGDVAAHLDKANAYDNYAVGSVDAADLVAEVGDFLDEVVCGMDEYVSVQDYFGIANITFIGVDANGKYVKLTGDKLGSAFTGTVDAHLFWDDGASTAVVYVD